MLTGSERNIVEHTQFGPLNSQAVNSGGTQKSSEHTTARHLPAASPLLHLLPPLLLPTQTQTKKHTDPTRSTQLDLGAKVRGQRRRRRGSDVLCLRTLGRVGARGRLAHARHGWQGQRAEGVGVGGGAPADDRANLGVSRDCCRGSFFGSLCPDTSFCSRARDWSAIPLTETLAFPRPPPPPPRG